MSLCFISEVLFRVGELFTQLWVINSHTRMTKCVFICLQLDKARGAYHKVSRKEQAAREREAHALGNPDVSIDKQKKIQEERALAQQEAEKVSGAAILF